VRLEVRLFATLSAYLPPASRGGGATVDVADGSTLEELAHRLGIPPDASWIALVNDEEATAGRELAPGDVVTLFPPLAGGGLVRRQGDRPSRAR
jgi:molybdopterin synthase sulfur carrier subunit